MSRKYKFANPEGIYFVSFATVYWIDVFTRPAYCDIVLESLKHCQQRKGMDLHCWCIMPSHLHLIFKAQHENPSHLLGRFKEFTSKAIRAQIAEHPEESRREWMLWMMKRAASKSSCVSHYQLWQHHNKPIELWSKEVIDQKIHYIHQNPVAAGFVEEAAHWRYSSATDYAGGSGLLNVDLLWEL